MFQLLEMTQALVASVTNRTEAHGDERLPAVSIGIEIEAPNTLLDIIDPKIREALYKAVDDQQDLPGVEKSTPVLRCNSFERHTLPTSLEGWSLAVDDGIDDTQPMLFGSVKCDKFSVEAKQGGTIVLRLRLGTSDVDADKLGKLAMHNGQGIWITLTAPKPGEAPKGAKAAEPDATDLFAGGEDEDQATPAPQRKPGPAEKAAVAKVKGGKAEAPTGKHQVPIKYRDSRTGETWSGRGLQPKWLKVALASGKVLADFEAKAATAAVSKEGAWPFPTGKPPSDESPPQSVTTERPPRTKRGKDATAAFIASHDAANAS